MLDPDHAGPDRASAEEDGWLLAVARGEREPLVDLYHRYERPVYRLGLQLLGDSTGAEDLVQDTFLRVWRHADRFDASRGSARAFVFTIARRAGIDAYRRAAVRPRTDLGSESGFEQVEPLETETVVEQAMAAVRVREAVEQLADKHREVIQLAYDGGLSQREVAERLGLPLGTVKTRTLSALKALRQVLSAQEVAVHGG